MKIYLSGNWQEFESMRFIASYKYIDDYDSWIFVAETLFQLPNGIYIIRIDYKLGPVYKGAKVGNKVFVRKYKIEQHPEIWLLTHGHELLAGFLFPNLYDEIRMDCVFFGDDEKKYQGQKLYSVNKVIRSFRDELPL